MANTNIVCAYSQYVAMPGVAVSPAADSTANSATFTVISNGNGKYWIGCEWMVGIDNPMPTAHTDGPLPVGQAWTQGPDSPLTGPNGATLVWYPQFSLDGVNWKNYDISPIPTPTPVPGTTNWKVKYTSSSDPGANITVMIVGGGGEPGV